ncbi:ThuA domain-containing protein [Sphaerisporangium sp. TRM90804]|uniref:ThuA domain-containing protein n=1 Tax=Sphaerisporangium sp. TRM90804 TaxID=3031113 RepID=UPI00244A626D|nr:ThuA domain-containing protein [Sphaerisporangium sp. TRM90804]MDH2426322.1 ThuA domain-containing protein [Sphaerisporangium sp. TRM90804]
MRNVIRRGLSGLALVAAALAMTPSAPAAARAADPAYEVLVFSKTAGFRHDSIPVGIQTIRELGAANNFTVTATEDAGAFTTANLARFKAVVWLSTTGDVLNDSQQTAFASYVNGGGGYVGVHAAADTEYDWSYYGQLVGAYFRSHPAIQQAVVKNEDRTHPATAGLGATWTRTDEWYNYRTNPRSTVRVLQSLDESSYSGGDMGGDHPITWCHPQASGRSFYTGLGHTQQSYAETPFRNLLLGGIRYVAGMVAADCTPTTTPPDPGGSTTVEGEAFTSQSGVQTAGHASASGGTTLGYIDNGDWAGYASVSTAGATGFSARVSSGGAGGTIQVRSGSQTGTVLGSVAVPNTGGWDTFRTVTTTLSGSASGPLFLTFTGGSGSLFDVDTVTISRSTTPPPAAAVEGEAFTSQSGVQTAGHASASGGTTLGYIDNGDWAGYASVSTAGATGFSARVSSGGAGGTIQVRSGSQTGTVLGSVAVPNTGGWDTFRTVTTTLSGSASGPVFLVFSGGTGALFDVDTFTLTR